MNGPDRKHDSKLESAGKLVGGYASKNLSEQEKQALFDAALHDQQLFDALMEEQALQDLLEEPGVKPELIQALQPKTTLMDRFQKWIRTPMAWGAAGAVATAALLVVVMMPSMKRMQVPSAARVVMPTAQLPELPAKPPETQPKPMRSQAQTAASAPAPQPQPVRAEPLQAKKEAIYDSVAPAPAGPPAQATDSAQAVNKVRQVAQEPPPAVAALQKSDAPTADRRDEKRELGAARLSEQAAPAFRNSITAPAPAVAFGVASAAALSVDYTLLRRNADGTFEPATTVRATDEVRLQVTPSHTGYLYLYRRESNGGNTTIVGAQRVTARQAVVVPSQGALAAGNQQYVLTFARDTNSPAAAPAGVIGGVRKMKRAAETDSSASSVRSVPSSPVPAQKAILPAPSASRATAGPGNVNTVMVEITIRPEEN